jgi:plastocyanin
MTETLRNPLAPGARILRRARKEQHVSVMTKSGALALLVVSLAAAGGGGDDEEAGGTEETTTEPAASGTALRGGVGPGFEIRLEAADGDSVETLSPGPYELEVEDQSGSHNFHLTGPGVDVSTDVSGEGTETFEIELQEGTYTFVCDPHATSMTGSFEVRG